MKQLNYHQYGHGEIDLLLLNGWGCSWLYWEPLITALKSDFTFYLFDYPGYDSNVQSTLSLDRYLDELLTVLPDRFHVCGWSLGGMLAIQLAMRSEERLESLVTVCTNPCFIAQDRWPGVSDQAFRALALLFERDPDKGIQRLQTLIFNKHIKQYSTIMTASIKAAKVSNILRQGLAFLKSIDLRKAFSELSLKNLHLFSEDDLLVPAAIGDKLSRLNPRGSIIQLSQSMHAPFYIRPDQVKNILLEFIYA